MLDTLREKTLSRSKNRLPKQDIAAAILIAALFLYFCFLVRRGFNTVDEGFYYTLPMRLINGDKLFVNEWHVSQLTSLFTLLPMKLFYVATGSFDGVILFFRYLYLFMHTATAVWLYAAVRRYGAGALGALTVFFVFVPFNIYAFNYYNIFLSISVVTASILFLKKRTRPAEYVLCGFLFACAVVDEPFSAFVYFFYTAAVFILKGKKAVSFTEKYTVFDFRNWIRITSGIAICVALFIPVFLRFTDISRLPMTFAELFNDSEYGFIMPDGTISIFRFFTDSVRYYGVIPIVCFVLWFAVFAYIKKRAPKHLSLMLPASLVIAVFAAVSLFVNVLNGSLIRVSVYRLVILFLGGAVLCCKEKKEPGLTACWFFGFFSTLLLDISSDVSVAFFSGISDIAMMLMLPSAVREARDNAVTNKRYVRFAGLSIRAFLREKKIPAGIKSRVAVPCLIFAFVCGLCFTVSVGSAFYYYAETNSLISPSALSVTLGDGPYKGIRTTPEVQAVYEGELNDYSHIAERSEGKPLYIISDESWPYIYTGMPCGAYTTWFVDQDYYFRQPFYWSLFPDKLPGYIYLPKYNRFSPNKEVILNDALNFVRDCCECTITETETGYIIKPGEWHLERAENFKPEYDEFA